MTEHRECPICRQDFQTANDQHGARRVHVDDIEMGAAELQTEEQIEQPVQEDTSEARGTVTDDEIQSTEVLEESLNEIEAELMGEAMTVDSIIAVDDTGEELVPERLNEREDRQVMNIHGTVGLGT